MRTFLTSLALAVMLSIVLVAPSFAAPTPYCRAFDDGEWSTVSPNAVP